MVEVVTIEFLVSKKQSSQILGSRQSVYVGLLSDVYCPDVAFARRRVVVVTAWDLKRSVRGSVVDSTRSSAAPRVSECLPGWNRSEWMDGWAVGRRQPLPSPIIDRYQRTAHAGRAITSEKHPRPPALIAHTHRAALRCAFMSCDTYTQSSSSHTSPHPGRANTFNLSSHHTLRRTHRHPLLSSLSAADLSPVSSTGLAVFAHFRCPLWRLSLWSRWSSSPSPTLRSRSR